MIAFYTDFTIPTWHGFVYVALIGVSVITKSAAWNFYFNIMTRLGVKVRTAIVSAIYRKVRGVSLGLSAGKVWTASDSSL